jgi:hypothetical protein
MTDQYCYTYEQLLALNQPDLSNYNLRLCGFFKDIAEHSYSVQVGRDVKNNYPNKYNIYFNRIKTRPKHVKSTDPELLKKIRNILAKLSPSNVENFTVQLIEMFELEPSIEWKSVAELVYINMIDAIFIVDVYTRLLIRLEENFPLLIHHLHHMVHQQAYTPRKFEHDIVTETAVDKTKRWAVSNGLLIVELFHRGKYRREYLNLVIETWLDASSPENTFYLDIMIKILPKLKKKNLNGPLIEKLTKISQDMAYKSRVRCLLNINE